MGALPSGGVEAGGGGLGVAGAHPCLTRPCGHSPASALPQKLKESDFAQQKLTDKNLGFQMLQRMGWKEGHGLGSRGKGIREPVGMYAGAPRALVCGWWWLEPWHLSGSP